MKIEKLPYPLNMAERELQIDITDIIDYEDSPEEYQGYFVAC